MQVAVLGAGFVVGVGAFVVWLAVMLRQDKAQRQALVAATQAHARWHRHVTRAARAESVPRATVPVVRAGSFCRVPGNVGHSKQGDVLVCQAQGSGRPRWRRAAALPVAS